MKGIAEGPPGVLLVVGVALWLVELAGGAVPGRH